MQHEKEKLQDQSTLIEDMHGNVIDCVSREGAGSQLHRQPS